jgi:hypothetical protein
MKVKVVAAIVIAAAVLSGCGFGDSEGGTNDAGQTVPSGDPRYGKRTIFDDFFGDGKIAGEPARPAATAAVVGVNSYLWRATLDTVSFMPLASADPFGGVIISDWYSPPATPGERFKVNIVILGRELRADGVRASVFRQRRDANGQWADAPIDPSTGTNIENAILTRARQMKLSATAAK